MSSDKLRFASHETMNLFFYNISGTSDQDIRDVFEKASRTAPAIVFIDHLDAFGVMGDDLHDQTISPSLAQLLKCMDESHRALQEKYAERSEAHFHNKPGDVLVIAATNRLHGVHPDLRKYGRFNHLITLDFPDHKARTEILAALTQNCKLDGTVDLSRIAAATWGFVGADLASVVSQAGLRALGRAASQSKMDITRDSMKDHHLAWLRKPWTPEDYDKLRISMVDLEVIIRKTVQLMLTS